MLKTQRTLRLSGSFGIAVFDNTQRIQQQKHQKFGKSSTMTLATSRIFLKPFTPAVFYSIQFPDDKTRVEITYLKQIIPSPHGMLPYEQYSVSDPSVYRRKEAEGDEDVATDLTGKRVTNYCRFVETLLVYCLSDIHEDCHSG